MVRYYYEILCESDSRLGYAMTIVDAIHARLWWYVPSRYAQLNSYMHRRRVWSNAPDRSSRISGSPTHPSLWDHPG